MITYKKLAWTECSPIEFVRRWETAAQGPAARLYDEHPGTKNLTRRHLTRLYGLWQNRSRLGISDRRNIARLAPALPSINSFRGLGRPKEAEVLDAYEMLTRTVGRRFSLKLFALHVALPRIFPPFSASRLAAYHFLACSRPGNTSPFSEALLPTYFEYQQFFFDLVTAAVADPSRVDKTLLALGQCLDVYYPKIRIRPSV